MVRARWAGNGLRQTGFGRLCNGQQRKQIGQTLFAIGFGTNAICDAVGEIGDLCAELVDLGKSGFIPTVLAVDSLGIPKVREL